MPRRVRISVVTGVASCLLALPACATAATTIGSSLPGGGLAASACAPAVPLSDTCTETSGGVPVLGDATGHGVITSWALHDWDTTASPMPVTLRVLLPLTSGGFRGVRTGKTEAFPTGEHTMTFSSRLPIDAGERIGFDHPIAATFCGLPAIGSHGQARFNGPLQDGEERSPGGYPGGACDPLIQARVEPDADGDGYGDETQDQCPAQPDEQGPCDLQGPATQLGKHPKNKTGSSKAKFTFSASEAGVSFECALDSKPFSACISPVRFRKLERGRDHKFRVHALDSHGNVGATRSFGWKVTG